MTDTLVPINDLPALPRDEDGPVFNEPWEAKAFALAVGLSEAGCFTWPEWVRIFSQEIKATWRRAYLNTPHGQPIELAAASKPERR